MSSLRMNSESEEPRVSSRLWVRTASVEREAFSGLDGLSPQARYHFTLADQVDQLVGASEADPDLGFMARLMALCSLPRTNPGRRKEYVRRNGPYALVMSAGGLNKLPFGNLPRLLLAWMDSKIYLGEAFFNEIIRHPVPLDMNILKALKRSSLGLDLPPLGDLPDLCVGASATA